VNVAPVITHRFTFSAAGVAQGFDTAARAAQTGAIKVMFDMQQQQQLEEAEGAVAAEGAGAVAAEGAVAAAHVL
jgi:hypothetical protein